MRTFFLSILVLATISISGISKAEEEKIYSRKDAYRASTNQIVLHYGEGVTGANMEADSLSDEGYPAIAVPGGSPGQVELFVGRGKFGKYSQSDLDSGTLGGSAMNFYDRKIGKDNSPKSEPSQ